MERVLQLIDDSRLLCAKKEYDIIKNNPTLLLKYKQIIKDNENKLNKLNERCEKVNSALKMIEKTNENWILSTNFLGVTTHYIVSEDNYLWIRMESTQHDIPLIEQLTVVYEVSLFNTWIPFCTESSLISRLSMFY